MASSPHADQLRYLLVVLKHTDLTKPRYSDVAAEEGISNANNAQKKFKAIIQAAGFHLDTKENKITGGDDDGGDRDGNKAPSKSKGQAKGQSASKPPPKAADRPKIRTSTVKPAAKAPRKAAAPKRKKKEPTPSKEAESDSSGEDHTDGGSEAKDRVSKVCGTASQHITKRKREDFIVLTDSESEDDAQDACTARPHKHVKREDDDEDEGDRKIDMNGSDGDDNDDGAHATEDSHYETDADAQDLAEKNRRLVRDRSMTLA